MQDASPDCDPVPWTASILSSFCTRPEVPESEGCPAYLSRLSAWHNHDHQMGLRLKEDDTYWCTADIGWITGHSYICYGPLSNGATVVMYEGAPNWPDEGRFWEIIEKYRVSIFYTAPTAIRSFIKWGNEWPEKYDLSSLRLLGSVGEPINPEAWMWYHRVIGQERCPIVDTWWQTETGAIMIILCRCHGHQARQLCSSFAGCRA